MYALKLIISSVFSVFVTTLSLQAQTFDIASAGEINLESDQIVSEGTVSEYFGMYVSGLGNSVIRLSVGKHSVQKNYEFKLANTKLVSYLFASDFVDLTSVAFRRGVTGTVKVEILDSNGLLQDSTEIVLNVDLGKKNCKKHRSNRSCSKLNLDKASKAQQKLLAKRFLSSIKGPIVLEP